ncbi:MAG: hypothetical protein ACQEW0_16395 [Pseudomonadota bacterium]
MNHSKANWLLAAFSIAILGVAIGADVGTKGLAGYAAGIWITSAWAWAIKEGS